MNENIKAIDTATELFFETNKNKISKETNATREKILPIANIFSLFVFNK